jgi:hypothetical protein
VIVDLKEMKVVGQEEVVDQEIILMEIIKKLIINRIF